jgi:uncharacterized repeat protein (TIGR01451 family)
VPADVKLGRHTLQANGVQGIQERSISLGIELISLPTVASAPRDLVASAGDGLVELSWRAPVETGGIPVLAYEVELSTDGGLVWTPFETLFSSQERAIIDGLVNRTTYQFRVRAVNDEGVGPYSEPSAAVTPRGLDAELEITIAVDEENPVLGDEVIFEITVTNQGGTAAPDVMVSGEMTPGRFAPLEVTATHGSYDEENRLWTIGTLGGGSTATLTIRAEVVMPEEEEQS